MTAKILKYLIDGDKLSLTLSGEEKFVAIYKKK